MSNTKTKRNIKQPISLSYINMLIRNKKLMTLLINGPKHSNKHTININNAKQWIDAQTTENRKLAAESIINTVIYIPHKYLLHTLKKTIKQFINEIKDKQFVIVTESTNKSGFLFTLLFCYYLHKKHKPIYKQLLNVNININSLFKHYNNQVTYLFINDMDYTGNQSSNYYRTIKHEIEIINLRCFQSSYAFNRYHNLKNKYKSHIINIVGEVLPSLFDNLKQTYPNDYLKRYKEICRYWGLCPDPKSKLNKYPHNYGSNCSITNIYFDHKIADPPSTLLLPLITGYVPIDDDYVHHYDYWCGKDHLTNKCDESTSGCIRPRANGNKKTKKQFYALIDKCKYGDYLQKYMKKYKYNLFDLTGEIENDALDIRCPFSWYKTIDYNTGRLTHKSKRDV